MHTSRAAARDQTFGQLEETRQRTRWLLSGVSDEDLARTHDLMMGPVIRVHPPPTSAFLRVPVRRIGYRFRVRPLVAHPGFGILAPETSRMLGPDACSLRPVV